MVLYAMTWDLPADIEKLQVYLNKARNDWLPTILGHPGVTDIAVYRNPLESSPQVLLVITFKDLPSWQQYIGSHDNERISLELRTLGCTGIVTRVWLPSSLTPTPLHHETAPGPAAPIR